ncbi:glucokinase [Roseospira marina]|uniref:Glucokinase n=1 Tax=Roseospira marina TaxID=140057 RepID=A0A5M6ICW9_9PROT|nr:glucokinase [Roseospira marina]KAA5605609.1 glucokinase [Roseospira marina]MBB4313322.1 glucokinase [Roseospira marina]MBB5085937.1 glucokinase [Roseospira marina]
MPAPPRPGLIADIGGTNARFALVKPDGRVIAAERLATRDFPGPVEAARAFLARHARDENAPDRAAWCIACPVGGDEVSLTNHPWTFSIASSRAALGLDALTVVNDFVANAMAIPELSPADTLNVGPEPAPATTPISAPIAALGPGTGLGVALLVPDGPDLWRPLATEGGHVTLAPTTAEEARVIAHLWNTYDHVSAERLVSGPGLALLYETLCALDGEPPAQTGPRAIAAAAQAGTDARAVRAVDMMFAFLGTVAGNLVLSAGALGGVYILGGIVPANRDRFQTSPFRDRFEAKGRFRDYLAGVPTRVVLHPNPAFPGLVRLLRDTGRTVGSP